MEPTGRPESRPEELEKFSLAWYGKELQSLFIAAAEAQRLSQPEFAFVVAFVQELSRDFISAKQIQEHYDRRSLDDYRGRVATLQRGTQEFFTTVEIGRWLRVCHDAMAKGQTPEQINQYIWPFLEEKLKEMLHDVPPASPREPIVAPHPVIKPVERPVVAAPVVVPKPEPPQPTTSWKKAALAAGALAVGAGGYVVHEAVQHHQQTVAAAAIEAERVKHQYDQIPANLRDHVVGVPDQGREAVPVPLRPDWTQLDDRTYQWNDRVLLAQPDGSALYIPADAEYNKAFMLPANARGNIDWRGARFPVQAIHSLDLSLGADGLWHNSAGADYAVLDGGHLLVLADSGEPTQFIPFNTLEPKPIAELEVYYRPRVDLSAIDTRIPAGFVDVEAQPSLASIQCDLSYRNYDNTAAGVPIYPADYKCMIPEQTVADLAAVEAELSTLGYHLSIGDAKRPLIVQAFLREVLGKWAAPPTPQANHVRGAALDITLLDATYIPVFKSGYKLPSLDGKAGKSLRSPVDKAQAVEQGWSEEEYAHWKTMHDSFVKHGYAFNKSERWHVDYVK